MSEQEEQKPQVNYDDFVEATWVTPRFTPNLKSVLCMSLGLGGETGEVLELLKKLYRDDLVPEGDTEAGNEFRRKLSRELGDVVYYVTKIAHEYGLTLGHVLKDNVEKLTARMKTGTLQGSGDDREIDAKIEVPPQDV